MYELIKSTISAGGYRLAEIQKKIKKLFLLGDLTEGEADELLALASRGVSADAERPENLKLIRELARLLAALEDRVAKLEGTGGETSPGFPAWKAWDGLSSDYQIGDIVTHGGQLWQSVFTGQNVWEPGTPGTEGLWQRYEGQA